MTDQSVQPASKDAVNEGCGWNRRPTSSWPECLDLAIPRPKQDCLVWRKERGRFHFRVVAAEGDCEVGGILLEPRFGFGAAAKQPFEPQPRDKQCGHFDVRSPHLAQGAPQ